MKSNRMSLVLVLCFSFVFFILPSNFVYADESPSLDIVFTDNNKGISGSEFSIYQVAELKADRTGYTVTSPFQWSGDLLTIRSSEDQLKLAQNLERQSLGASPVMTQITGLDGVIHFTGLNNGIYLVVQTKQTGVAAEYSTMQPFLVMVPQWQNGVWRNHVSAKPKPVVRKPIVPPHTPPDTRDSNNAYWWSGLWMISTGMLVLLVINRKNKIGEMVR